MDSSVLANLAAALRTSLAEQFATGSDELLTFEAFGVPIDPDTLRATPGGPFNAVLVAEHLTRLTDKIGQIVDGQFHRHWVASEVFGALLGSTVADSGSLSAFGAIKDPAEQAYRGANPTFPTKAMPDDWYDPSIVGNWMIGHSVSSESAPAPTGGGSGLVAAQAPDRWELRVAATQDQPALAALRQPDAVLALAPIGSVSADFSPSPAASALGAMAPSSSVREVALDTPQVANISTSQSAHEMLLASKASSPASRVSAKRLTAIPVDTSATFDSVSTAPALEHVLPAGTAATAPVSNQPVVAVQSNDTVNQWSDIAVTALPATSAANNSGTAVNWQVNQLYQDPDVMRAVLAGVDSNAGSTPVAASSLTVSFDLCPVTIDRDWWSWLLIRTPGWILPLWSSGQLIPGLPASDGTPPPPCGLPATMLVIKNLQISGWSNTDLAALPQAASLGPFSFAGGTQIVNGTLTAGGMQVIGWVCELLPAIPPAAAPPT